MKIDEKLTKFWILVKDFYGQRTEVRMQMTEGVRSMGGSTGLLRVLQPEIVETGQGGCLIHNYTREFQ